MAGGGFAHESTITISGNYDSGTGTGQSTKPATTVVASAPATTAPAASVTVATSAPPKGYDPNDWTTWPKADVASFLPPGKSVQQFKVGAEKDLDTYRKNLAALPATGLTSAQQSQKAGMEAQIRSLEFQVDTANRALGLPSASTTTVNTASAAPAAPAASPGPAVPVMSAAAIAATVKLQTNLSAAEKTVNDRAQQIASANQQLAQFQAQRAAASDPAQQKGLDAAISSAKFQIDVMQQALDRDFRYGTFTPILASSADVGLPSGTMPCLACSARILSRRSKSMWPSKSVTL